MTRRTIDVRGQTYTYSPDDDTPLAARMWAVVGRRVLDELVKQPPTSAITIESDWPGLTPRVASDGLVGLVGVPLNAFQALPQDIDLTIRAAGYVPHRETVTIPHSPGFPNTFIPAKPADVLLHREPVVISGRIVHANGLTITPVSDATVSLSRIWRRLPLADEDMETLAEDPNIVSLQPPLYPVRDPISGRVRRIPAGTGHLRRVEMVPIAGADKELLEAVHMGDDHLRLSNQEGLAPTAVLALDIPNPDFTEYLTINRVDGASDPSQPATVTLVHPVAYPHRHGVRVQVVRPEMRSSDYAFGVEAISGDSCVYLARLDGLAGENEIVQVAGEYPPVEYHHLRLISATIDSDADGYYHLPPLSRVAALELGAIAGTETAGHGPVSPNYVRRENRIDIVFSDTA